MVEMACCESFSFYNLKKVLYEISYGKKAKDNEWNKNNCEPAYRPDAELDCYKQETRQADRCRISCQSPADVLDFCQYLRWTSYGTFTDVVAVLLAGAGSFVAELIVAVLDTVPVSLPTDA